MSIFSSLLYRLYEEQLSQGAFVVVFVNKYDFLKYNSTEEIPVELLREMATEQYGTMGTNKIMEAFIVARNAHGEQLRSDGASFIIHPIRVALMLMIVERDVNYQVVIAALLHDTLEDTSLTSLLIEEKFGKYVVKLVQALTRRQNIKNLSDKQEAKRQHWREVMHSSHPIRAIKTFEDLDNMICWKAIPEGSADQKKIPRWLEEAREMSLPLAEVTNAVAFELMQQEYSYYVERGYGYLPIVC